MDQNVNQFRSVWDQTVTPVIYRNPKPREKNIVKLPYSVSNRAWLQQSGRVHPIWVPDKKYWEVPKSWFDDLVLRILKKYKKIYIIQPYNEMEKCAPACKNARGFECQCSCMGANHGAGDDGSWYDVNEAFSFRWRGAELACRLLTFSDSPPENR